MFSRKYKFAATPGTPPRSANGNDLDICSFQTCYNFLKIFFFFCKTQIVLNISVTLHTQYIIKMYHLNQLLSYSCQKT